MIFHMLEEIRQQPDVIRSIIDDQLDRVQILAQAIRSRGIIYAYIAARGTSDHAAIYAKYLLETQLQMPVALAAPSVLTVYGAVPHFGPHCLVIGVSQSGAGPDVVAVVRRARETGTLTACITNEPDSELASTAEFPLFIGAGLERSVAATKTYTGSLALFALLAAVMESDQSAMLADMRKAADDMDKVIGLSETLHRLAGEFRDLTDCVVLARGYNQCTASEIALKLTETCYVGAKAYSAADFQHGPIAQVYSGFPIFLFAPDGKAFPSVAEVAARLRLQSARLLTFAHSPSMCDESALSLPMPANVPEWISPLVYAVAGQLIAYWIAVERGNNPDMPRNLRKVTRTL